MKARSVRIGLVQHACSDNLDENIAKASSGVRDAAARGATVVCLPELFGSRYFCQVQDPKYFELAEPSDGRTVTSMEQLAKELGVTILAGFFEYRAPGLCHNSLAVLGPAGKLGLYRKMHIPQDPQFEEKFYFTPGDTGFMAIEAPDCVVGPLICWDQWYPEAARLTAMQGAEVLFYPSVGCRKKRRNTAKISGAPGKPSSAPTRSPTACSLFPSIGLAWRRRQRVKSSFGDTPSCVRRVVK
jgi:N-carbamoylputrescine amidase